MMIRLTLRVRGDFDTHLVQIEAVAKRDQVVGALCRHDSGDPRHGKHVSLRRVALGNHVAAFRVSRPLPHVRPLRAQWSALRIRRPLSLCHRIRHGSAEACGCLPGTGSGVRSASSARPGSGARMRLSPTRQASAPARSSRCTSAFEPIPDSATRSAPSARGARRSKLARSV